MAQTTTIFLSALAGVAVMLAGGCSAVTPVQTALVTDAGPSLNGCVSTSYSDQSGTTGNRTVSFGGMNNSPPFGFSPACMTIAAGQTVTFSGIFAAHPLAAGTGPLGMDAGSPNSPILNTTDGSTVTFTFATAGMYPYYCQMHYASGMVGVIQVM